MATATERKFTSLRKRLDQLGYRQPLAIESLPLVEKLFGDLLHTTESLKNAKLQLGKHREQKGVWERHVEPYRADNARLVKENCELHQQMIKVKESWEARARDLRANLRRLEHENTDLKFLNTQYIQRLRSQEKESQAKSEKILELQEKNFHAVVQTPGGKKKQIPIRRQRMELDSTIPKHPPPATAVPPRTDPPDPYVVDLLQLADQRIADLQGSVEKGEKEKKKLELAVQGLRRQVENREVEIERLNEMLSGGRPPEALASEGVKESSERMVAHLNIQVDFLQQANRELEGKLSASMATNTELEARVLEVSGKNSRICSELQEIGELVKQMEAERKGSEDGQRERVTELEVELSEVVKVKQSLERSLRELEREREELRGDNRRMAEMLATSEGDTKEVAELLERLTNERKQLQSQCQHYRDSEAGLQKRLHEMESGVTQGHSVSVELRRVRRERDQLKEAVANFETELMQIQNDTRKLAEDRDNFKLLYEQVSEEVSHLRLHSRAPTSSTALLRRLEGERDDARLELGQLRAENTSLRDRLRSRQSSQQHDLATMEDRIAELQLQLDETCRERDELNGRLSSLREMVKSLEAELQSSSGSLSSANAELSRYRVKVTQLQGLVDSSERGREERNKGLRASAGQIQEAQANAASLTAKIVQLEGELVSRDERISELRHSLATLDSDHDTLRAEADSKDEAISDLQRRLEEQTAEKAELESRVCKSSSQLSAMEERRQSQSRELASVRDQLVGVRGEGEQMRAANQALSQQNSQLRDDLNTMTQETQALHDELRRAVEERESLRAKVQEYAQSVLRYEEAIAVKEQEKADLLDSYRALSSEADKKDSTVQYSLEEASTAKVEMASLSQEKLHLEELVQQQALEIQQHLASLQAYELQLSSLTHSLSKMETALRQEQEEKKALVADLNATRDLCVQLDKTKESLSRQVASQAVGYEQLQGQLSDMQAERDLIKSQLAAERSTNHNLQTLLSNERKKEFQAHLSSQAKETEVQRLRQQITRLEADRLSLMEQLRSARSEAVVKGEEVQRLKTELTAEKFQTEHAKQQLHQLRTARNRSPLGSRAHSHLTASRSPSPSPSHMHPSQSDSKQESPSVRQQPDSMEGERAFARERESLTAESARLVGKLLSSSSHSTSLAAVSSHTTHTHTPHSPTPHSPTPHSPTPHSSTPHSPTHHTPTPNKENT